jgi:predicted transcriptional regulator
MSLAKEIIELDELTELFESLKGGSKYSLPDALEKAVSVAKSKNISVEEFISQLSSYGIESSEELSKWIKEKF